ncbi:MAG TPA: hypothetical protein VMZ69_04845 [Saprospiraceae bacterium]|nr:hypothetical protein [Saprospiraceae bacterium]
MKVIITGSTGMIGKGCLLECIDNPQVESILLVNRHPIDVKHPKIKEVLVKDFFELELVRDDLKGYDACFYCMGVTSAGMNEADYSRITFEATIEFAKELFSLNPYSTFCYISGAGSDSSEKGNTMWARVKGKTENALLAIGFRNTYMFRPGFIQPTKGIRSRTGWYNAVYTILGPFYFLLKRLPNYVTNTTTLAKAMIKVASDGYPKKILESADINKIGSE